LSAKHSAGEYIAQAESSAVLARFLRKEKSEYLDWAVTCLFYSVIHYVNACLTKDGKVIPRRHVGTDARAGGRTNIVQQDPSLQRIYNDYRHLDDESRDARYELRHPSKAEFDAHLMPKYVRIESFAKAKLA
jgi:hypothetical protein